MTWSVSADPVDFLDAVAWFKKRVPMTKADFRRLTAAAKRKAFTVANVAQLDLVNQVWDAIDRAIKDGTSLEDFKKSIGDELRRAWAGSVDDPPWRLETIFRANVQLAYGAGRYRQATHPDVVGDRPVWMFDAVLDSRTTPICSACDGTKRPSTDAWWKTHTPPLHFNCRSSFIALTDKQAGKITFAPPTAQPDDGFGLPPGADEWTPNPSSYPPPLAKTFALKQALAPAPPPPSALTKGKQFLNLAVRSIPKATVDDLLGSIQDAELLSWLEKHPLSDLAFRPQVRGVNGQYIRSAAGTFKIEVTAARKPHTFGAAFQPGTIWSISQSMQTAEDAAKATLRHELGHHIHLFDGRSTTVDAIIAAAYARARAANVFISRYARTNKDEYFAESFAAYYLRQSALKQHDPNGFQMVEDVLRERGILP